MIVPSAQCYIADTGLLYAYFDRSDTHTDWAVEVLQNIPPTLYTCEAVIAETIFLLRKRIGGKAIDALMQMVEEDLIVLAFDAASQKNRLRQLLKKYDSVPMSFADACLVVMTELHESAVVCTTDSDFAVYRKHGRGLIEVISPF